VKNGVVAQELVARYFPSGEMAAAALREEEKKREAYPENARQAELFERGHISEKQIVDVSLSGTTLVVMFHDQTIQREPISHLASLAISHLLSRAA
jgi:hypothetical protein